MSEYTTIGISAELREVLDLIVEKDPRYENRTELVRAWVWEKVQSLGYFDESKIEKAAQAQGAQ